MSEPTTEPTVEPPRLTWDQRGRIWTCREGGRIWPEGSAWRWEIAGAEGAARGLWPAVQAASDAWRASLGGGR